MSPSLSHSIVDYMVHYCSSDVISYLISYSRPPLLLAAPPLTLTLTAPSPLYSTPTSYLWLMFSTQADGKVNSCCDSWQNRMNNSHKCV